MEQLHFITKLLDIKDPNIQIMDAINKGNFSKELPLLLAVELSLGIYHIKHFCGLPRISDFRTFPNSKVNWLRQRT